MKYGLLILVFLCSIQFGISQDKELKPVSLEFNYFEGSIIEHNPDIAHLITDFPKGFIFLYNRKTYGYNEPEARYNFPDWGFTVIYQDLKNPFLGENIGVYGHFTWYFLKRHLSIGVGQGIAYASNPYDKETNFENNAYGSRFLSSTYVRAQFVKENLYKGWGLTAGLGLIHYSNANFKAPNNSTNTLYMSAGVSYQFDHYDFPGYYSEATFPSRNYAERIHYNAVIRSGVNEADVNGLGVHPFVTISLFADKRINYKSTFTVGVDFFFSEFLIDLIRYRTIAFPGDGLTGDEDYRRIGAFIGHEWRFNKNAFVSQLGYYVYWPYEFERRVYNRLGLKRYMFNNTMFVSATVKAHWAKAEAAEFGIGVRL